MGHRNFTILLFVLYIILMTAIMIWQGIGIAPDRYAFILLLGSLLIKKTRSFLMDWIPFLFILVSYDFLRGFADNLAMRVHIVELIDADKFMFLGILPTVELQKLFYNPNSIHFYDYIATVMYFLHFALPLGFGFILWLYDRMKFRQFVTAILLLSYAGWITYIIYPAAPPWMAGQDGYIVGVSKIMDTTSSSFSQSIDLPTIYHKFNPNPVAAIPSMHAAYPLLILLLALRFFGPVALVFLPYVLVMWVSVVYLGEHYVIDVVIGAIYAILFYVITTKYLHTEKFNNLFRNILALLHIKT